MYIDMYIYKPWIWLPVPRECFMLCLSSATSFQQLPPYFLRLICMALSAVRKHVPDALLDGPQCYGIVIPPCMTLPCCPRPPVRYGLATHDSGCAL